MSDKFYPCKRCRQYVQGREAYRLHKQSCFAASSVAKRRTTSWSLPQTIKNIPVSRVSTEQVSTEMSLAEEDTDEFCSPGKSVKSAGAFEPRRSVEKELEEEEEEEMPFKITSVVGGYGGMTSAAAPMVVRKEDVWRREKATIPILLEKIKVEPVDDKSPPCPASGVRPFKVGSSQIEAKRRLKIQLEPIADSICRYVFTSPVKCEPDVDVDGPVTHTPVPPRTSGDDCEEICPQLPLNSSAPLEQVATFALSALSKEDVRTKAKDVIEEESFVGRMLSEVSEVPEFEKMDVDAEVAAEEVSPPPPKCSDPVEGKKKGKAIIYVQWGIIREGDADAAEGKEELSPASSYVDALNAPRMRRKRRKSVAVTPLPPPPTDETAAALQLPAHITLLKQGDELVKPLYQCNFCLKELQHETQFFPHKLCQFQPKELEDEKKTYCKCGNGFVGEYNVPMIQCSECLEWYHGMCIGYSDEWIENYPEHQRWDCYKCKQHPETNNTPAIMRKLIRRT